MAQPHALVKVCGQCWLRLDHEAALAAKVNEQMKLPTPHGEWVCRVCGAKQGDMAPGYCNECVNKLAKEYRELRENGPRNKPLPKPLDLTPYGPAGVSSASTGSREKDMRYMTAPEVKAYVSSWLRYIGNQPMSSPRYYQRLRALEAPKAEHNRVRGQGLQGDDLKRT